MAKNTVLESEELGDPAYLFRMVIVADSNSLKCTYLKKYQGNQKYMNLDKGKVKVEIYDTSGKQALSAIGSSFYQELAGILFICSLIKEDSHNDIEQWIESMNRYAPANICKEIIGYTRGIYPLYNYNALQNLVHKYKIPYVDAITHGDLERAVLKVVDNFYNGISSRDPKSCV